MNEKYKIDINLDDNSLVLTSETVAISYCNSLDRQLVKAIYQLQQENKELKELLYTKNFEGDAPKIISIFEKIDKGRINKLENIIKELKSWLEENWKQSQDIWFVKIINKLNELEGKNE